MRKCLMILLFCCYTSQTLPSDDRSFEGMVLLIGVVMVSGVYGIYQDVASTINYWTTIPDPVCVECSDACKHANKLTKLPCGHALCSLCKQAKVDVANRHNSKLINIRYENLVYPVCSCGKKFDFDVQEQQQSYKNAQVGRSAVRPFKFTLITNICVTGCGNKISQVLDCGHSMCRSCLTSKIMQAVQVAGSHAKVHCPVCNCNISLDRFKNL